MNPELEEDALKAAERNRIKLQDCVEFDFENRRGIADSIQFSSKCVSCLCSAASVHPAKNEIRIPGNSHNRISALYFYGL